MGIFLTFLFWIIGVYLFAGLCVAGWACFTGNLAVFKQNWKTYLAIIFIWPYVLKNLMK